MGRSHPEVRTGGVLLVSFECCQKMGINAATLAKDPFSLYKELPFVVDVACQVAPLEPTPLICETYANCIREENNPEDWKPSFPADSMESSESGPPSPSKREQDGSQDLFEPYV